jgi:large subunit ribosomal protein L30
MSKIRLTLVKGKSGVTERQIRTLQALGLRKRTSKVEIEETDITKGMVAKVQHLVEIEKL